MPNLDGTGPLGNGRLTGRRHGNCVDGGGGRGMGMGCGRRQMGGRRQCFYGGIAPNISLEERAQMLEEELRLVRSAMEK